MPEENETAPYTSATVRFSQQTMPQQYCPQVGEITITVNLEGMSFDEAAAALAEAWVDAKSNVLYQLGVDFTVDEQKAIRMVAESLPQPIMEGKKPAAGGRSGGSGSRSGGGSSRSGGGGGGSRGGGGFGGRNAGRGGSSRGGSRGGNNDKQAAADEIIQLWEDGGAEALADAGWEFFEGDYGDCLRCNNYNGSDKAMFVNDKLIDQEIIDSLR